VSRWCRLRWPSTHHAGLASGSIPSWPTHLAQSRRPCAHAVMEALRDLPQALSLVYHAGSGSTFHLTRSYEWTCSFECCRSIRPAPMTRAQFRIRSVPVTRSRPLVRHVPGQQTGQEGERARPPLRAVARPPTDARSQIAARPGLPRHGPISHTRQGRPGGAEGALSPSWPLLG
jgi:hypothetical protein